ncbi:scavenger receptor cysteine-rich type 1 protein M130-like [Mugil cephalus]|uniref:scavenger receptor cysteine-rich type 1 protein M130-like n=1 Tax=Mugil cephalus TaxID=48193 RepID=UPI001FB7D938|nr:scavenger receptor cysteine-rich type 1 protein M130-like [Mugil cephalus]
MSHRVLMLFLSVWSSGLWAEDKHASTVPGDYRLVNGGHNCSGLVEVYDEGTWRNKYSEPWEQTEAAAVCRKLNCGSVVSLRRYFNHDGSDEVYRLRITCSESLRLVNGTSRCSGRLEERSNQSWSLVCKDGFQWQEAEKVCRELECGPPSALFGELHREKEAPLGSKELQCPRNESDHEAAVLICSEQQFVKLHMAGASRCSGKLMMRQLINWLYVDEKNWDLKVVAAVCRRLDCGSPVSIRSRSISLKAGWRIKADCDVLSSDCLLFKPSTSVIEITCSDSVRLVNGTNLCSGRLEVQFDWSWSSVSEDGFDQQDAEVVCRELGCGPPSVLQGALFTGGPVWRKGFECEGTESALLACNISAPDRTPSSANRSVQLTCSDPNSLRLVGESSLCAGKLEMTNKGEWRPVVDWELIWNQVSADAVCRRLGCGTAVSANMKKEHEDRPVWWIKSSCIQSTSVLRDCVTLTGLGKSSWSMEVVCSELLLQPTIVTFPNSMEVFRVDQRELQVLLGSSFSIMCYIPAQYQGGYFQLLFTASNAALSYSLPAVNHSAHFRFPSMDLSHQGSYSCIYHLHVFSQDFSSKSQTIYLRVGASVTDLIIRLVVLLLGMTLSVTAICCYSKRLAAKARVQEKTTVICVGGEK